MNPTQPIWLPFGYLAVIQGWSIEFFQAKSF